MKKLFSGAFSFSAHQFLIIDQICCDLGRRTLTLLDKNEAIVPTWTGEPAIADIGLDFSLAFSSLIVAGAGFVFERNEISAVRLVFKRSRFRHGPGTAAFFSRNQYVSVFSGFNCGRERLAQVTRVVYCSDRRDLQLYAGDMPLCNAEHCDKISDTSECGAAAVVSLIGTFTKFLFQPRRERDVLVFNKTSELFCPGREPIYPIYGCPA